MITGQRKTLFLGEGKLRFFSVHHSKWNETFTWRDYTMSIIVSLCLSMAHKECLVRNIKWFSFNRWLWVSLVIANSEERGKWKSSLPPREQRWLEVGGWFLRGLKSGTTTGLSWFITIGIWHAVSCLKVELSWGKLEIGISFPFWIVVLIYFILTGDRV